MESNREYINFLGVSCRRTIPASADDDDCWVGANGDRSLNLVFHSTLPQSSLYRQKHDLAFFFFFFFGPQRLYGVLLSRITAILDMIVFSYCI